MQEIVEEAENEAVILPGYKQQLMNLEGKRNDAQIKT